MKQFVTKMQEQFTKMCSTNKLFRAKVTGDDLYTMYLMAFPDGTNPVFRDPASSTQTKVKEDNEARKRIEDKEHNQKILGILAKKKEDSLEKMTVEELEAQLR